MQTTPLTHVFIYSQACMYSTAEMLFMTIHLASVEQDAQCPQALPCCLTTDAAVLPLSHCSSQLLPAESRTRTRTRTHTHSPKLMFII